MGSQERERETKSVHSWITSITTVLWAFLILFIVSLFTWGHQQEITPEAVAHRLKLGMTPEQANFELGLPKDWLMAHSHKDTDGRLYANATDTGIVGEMFVPQHQITLIFDSRRRLESAYVKYHWRADKMQVPIRIARAE